MARNVSLAFSAVAVLMAILAVVAFALAMSLTNSRCKPEYFPGTAYDPSTKFTEHYQDLCASSLSDVHRCAVVLFVTALLVTGFSVSVLFRAKKWAVIIALVLSILAIIALIVTGIIASIAAIWLTPSCEMTKGDTTLSHGCYICQDSLSASNCTSLAYAHYFGTSTLGTFIYQSTADDNGVLIREANAVIVLTYVVVVFMFVLSIMSCVLVCCSKEFEESTSGEHSVLIRTYN